MGTNILSPGTAPAKISAGLYWCGILAIAKEYRAKTDSFRLIYPAWAVNVAGIAFPVRTAQTQRSEENPANVELAGWNRGDEIPLTEAKVAAILSLIKHKWIHPRSARMDTFSIESDKYGAFFEDRYGRPVQPKLNQQGQPEDGTILTDAKFIPGDMDIPLARYLYLIPEAKANKKEKRPMSISEMYLKDKGPAKIKIVGARHAERVVQTAWSSTEILEEAAPVGARDDDQDKEPDEA